MTCRDSRDLKINLPWLSLKICPSQRRCRIRMCLTMSKLTVADLTSVRMSLPVIRDSIPGYTFHIKIHHKLIHCVNSFKVLLVVSGYRIIKTVNR